MAYIDPHVDGYLTCGSVGEGASLTLDERIAVMQTVAAFRENSTPRGTWFFGTSGTALPEMSLPRASLRGLRRGRALDPQPSYFAISPPMPQQFFAAVAGMSDLPVVIYDNPYPTSYYWVPMRYST